jgi:transglutaminase-like putative cysteine protease
MAAMKFIRKCVDAAGWFVLINLGVLALLNCILAYTKFTVLISDVIFSIILSSILYLSIYIDKRIGSIYCRLLFIGAGLYIACQYRVLLYSSLLYIGNGFIEVLKQPYHLNIILFKLPTVNYMISQRPIIWLFIFLAVTGLSFLLKINKGRMLLLLMTLPICIVGLYFGVLPDYHSIMGIFAFGMAVYAYDNRKRPGSAAIRVGIIVLMVFLSGTVIQMAEPKSSYVPSHFMQYLPQGVKDLLNDYLSPADRATAMDDIRHGMNGQGQLGDMDNLTQTGRKIMQVSTSLQTKDHLYLRNYFGAVYQNNSWNDLPEEAYRQYNKLFAAYSPGAWYDQSVIIFEALKEDRKGQNELMKYMAGNTGYADFFTARQFKIEKMFSEKEQYFFPYNMDISSPAFKYDRAAQETGTKLYKASAYNMPANYGGIDAFIEEYGQYNKYLLYYAYEEKDYRAFVYNNYLQVPKGALDEFSEHFPIRQVRTDQERDELIAQLQQYFQKNYHYTTAPGKVPQGRDFVEYFLDDSHEGYCTYFASAATLILRQAGIPARYVVGYAIPAETINNGAVIGSDAGKPIHDFTVVDKQAHAWVEIYENGWGWRPVEFTPGFVSPIQDKEMGGQTKQQSDKQQQQNPNKNIDKPRTTQHQDNGKSEQHNSALTHTPIGWTIVVLVVISGITAAVVWQRKCRNDLQRCFACDINAANQAARTKEIYGYMERLANYNGLMRPGHMDYLVYADYLQQNEKNWHDIDIRHFVEIVLAVRFGENIGLNRKAVMDMLTTVQKMRNNIYIKLNLLQKLLFTYIYKL